MENLKVQFLRGVSGSGKSTYRNQFLNENPDWACVSRDDIRFMLHNEAYAHSNKNEDLVSVIEMEAIEGCIYAEKNILVDATNLNPNYLRAYFSVFARMMKKNNNSFEFSYKEFNLPLEAAKSRNAQRTGIRRVPDAILEKQYNQFTKEGRTWENLFKKFASDPLSALQELPQNPALPMAAVFDIDGTLALKSARSAYDWTKMGTDAINAPVKLLLGAIKAQGIKILIFTGREDTGDCKPITLKWLQENGISYDGFFIRKNKDHRKDFEVKREMLQEASKSYNIVFAVDDRTQVVEKCWRQSNIPCFQVEKNSF